MRVCAAAEDVSAMAAAVREVLDNIVRALDVVLDG